MDPTMLAGLSAGAGGLFSGLSGLFGRQSQAKAAQKYIDYLRGQRDLFLGQPEVGPLRALLGRYATGKEGYDPTALEGMRSGITEDYGRGLNQLGTEYGRAGIQPGAGSGVYRPGAQARTMRLLGENLNVRKAEANRALAMKNEQQKLANVRFASSALPAYMPGLPSTPVPGAETFMAAQGPSAGEWALGPIGSALSGGAGLYGMLNRPQPQWPMTPQQPGGYDSGTGASFAPNLGFGYQPGQSPMYDRLIGQYY